MTKSKIRAHVLDLCGGGKQDAEKQFIRSIGLPKATLLVDLKNMVYNSKRLSQLLEHVIPTQRPA